MGTLCNKGLSREMAIDKCQGGEGGMGRSNYLPDFVSAATYGSFNGSVPSDKEFYNLPDSVSGYLWEL